MFHLPRAVTTIRRDFTAKFLVCFPEMSSLHIRGRKLKRVAAARYVDGRVVGPKLGACSNGQKPTASQFPWFPTLYSADSPAIAKRPGPTYGVAGFASPHVLEAWGRLSPAPPRATLVWEPLRFLVAVLVREPRA